MSRPHRACSRRPRASRRGSSGPRGGSALALVGEPRARPARRARSRARAGRWLNDGHEPVVGLGVDRHGPGAERRLRSGAGARTGCRSTARCGVRYQRRPGTGRRGRARRRRSPRPRAGGRPRSAGPSCGVDERRCFVEPDVGDDACRRPTRRAPPRTSSGSAPTGAQAKHSSRAVDRLLDRRRRAVDRARARRAARAAPDRGSKPTTSAPSTRSRAARPIEPPISPTPRTAMRIGVSTVGQAACRPARAARLELAQVGRELVGEQRLRAVADRLLGARVHLDDDPVGARRGRGQRQRQHQVAPPGRVARVDDDRQVRELLAAPARPSGRA